MILRYNSHYIIASKMFCNPAVMSVFQYLMDKLSDLEYRAIKDKIARRKLEDNPSTINLSIPEIVDNCGTGKNTASQILKNLERIGLISCNRAQNGRLVSCEILRERYYSIISFFSQLNDEEQKVFSQSLYQKRGIEEYPIPMLSKERIAQENNKAIQKLPKLGDVMAETPQLGRLEANISPFGEIDHTNLPNQGVFNIPNLGDMVDFIIKNSPNRELLDPIYDISPEFWEVHAEEITTQSLIDDPEGFLEQFPTFKTPCLGRYIALKLPKLVDSEVQYIINNKKEESNERSEAQVDREGGMGEEEDDFGVVNPQLEEFNPVVVIEQDVKVRRRQEQLLKFSAEEVDEIISDITACLDSPDKIFINRLWNYLEDYFSVIPDDSENEDETQNLSEGDVISADSFKHIFQDAYEATVELIKNKKFTPDDDDLPVADFEFSTEDAAVVLGWKQFKPYNQPCSLFKIVKDGFYSLQRPKAVAKPQSRRCRRSSENNPSNRKEDLQYIQKINLMGLFDEGFEQLTPIEQFIYNFCYDFLQVGEDGEVNGVLRDQLAPSGVDRVKTELYKRHIPFEVFSEICFQEVPRNPINTDIRPRMFSADKIRAANQNYGFTSIIDQTSLEELLEKSS